MKKATNYIVFTFKSIGWTSLFVGLQTIFMLMALVITMWVDVDAQDSLIKLFEMSATTAEVPVDTYMLLYEFLMDLLIKLIVPTEILLVISFIFIYLLINNSFPKYMKAKTVGVVNTSKLISLALLLNLGISFILMFVPAEIMDSTGYTQAVDFTSLNPFWGVIAVGICAPLCEEITFRYLCFNRSKKINFWYAAIIPSLMFGLVHMNIIQSTYAFVLSMIFIIFNKKYNSILPGIIMHLTINTSSSLLMYLPVNEMWFLIGITVVSCMITLIMVKVNGSKIGAEA